MNGHRLTNLTLGGTEWVPRFISALDQKLCSQCCLCIRVCPASVFKRTVKGTIEAVNRNACRGCGVCERVCPEAAIKCLPVAQND